MRIESSNEQFVKGVMDATSVVASTMGPHGRAVMVCGGGGMEKTYRDGYKSIMDYRPSDPMELAGVDRVRAALARSVSEAGDGSTHTAVLMSALWQVWEQFRGTGVPPRVFVEGVDAGVEEVCGLLSEMAVPADAGLVRAVCVTAANGDVELGSMISELVLSVGAKGNIGIEQSMTGKVEVEKIKGMAIPYGVRSTDFYNSSRGAAYEERIAVAVATELIEDQTALLPLLQAWKRDFEGAPLVVFCPRMTGDALSMFTARQMAAAGGYVRVPWVLVEVSSEDVLADIAAVAGCEVMDKRHGRPLRDAVKHSGVFGEAVRFSGDANRCSLVPASSEASAGRAEFIEGLLGQETVLASRESLTRRLSSIRGTIGVVRVPVFTAGQATFDKEVVEDSVRAGLAALEEGVIRGCGLGLREAGRKQGGAAMGVVCGAPHAVLMRNSSMDEREVAGDEVVDLVRGEVVKWEGSGIVDSAKVCQVALRSAWSEVRLWVLTGSFIVVE